MHFLLCSSTESLMPLPIFLLALLITVEYTEASSTLLQLVVVGELVNVRLRALFQISDKP
jgi:hypothetical protein